MFVCAAVQPSRLKATCLLETCLLDAQAVRPSLAPFASSITLHPSVALPHLYADVCVCGAPAPEGPPAAAGALPDSHQHAEGAADQHRTCELDW